MSNYDSELQVRLDKWWWASRFFKTRAIAKQEISKGRVLYNNHHSKVSKQVEVGALITIKKGHVSYTVKVLMLSDVRRNYSQAQALYQETDESIAGRLNQTKNYQINKQCFTPSQTKPNKKQRRNIIEFKKDQSNK